MLINKLLNFIVPSTVFFEDGSRVEHLSRNDTLLYVSPSGCIIQVTLLYDKKANELRVKQMGNGWFWQVAGWNEQRDPLEPVVPIAGINFYLESRPGFASPAGTSEDLNNLPD
jgi:hypothetical protein